MSKKYILKIFVRNLEFLVQNHNESFSMERVNTKKVMLITFFSITKLFCILFRHYNVLPKPSA